jgi:hypothetical protein
MAISLLAPVSDAQLVSRIGPKEKVCGSIKLVFCILSYLSSIHVLSEQYMVGGSLTSGDQVINHSQAARGNRTRRVRADFESKAARTYVGRPPLFFFSDRRDYISRGTTRSLLPKRNSSLINRIWSSLSPSPSSSSFSLRC